MTTQIDSSSPFIENSNSTTKTSLPQEDFSIHTMQDDLLTLQKKGFLEETVLEKNIPNNISTPPTAAPQEMPQKPLAIDVKEAPLQAANPFGEKIPKEMPEKSPELIEVSLESENIKPAQAEN